MREILFRGNRVDNGALVYGWLCRTFSNGITRTYIMLPGFPCTVDGFTYIEVIAETVGQYTGLTDKNGTRIFEGDIIEWQYGCREKYQVIFEDGHFIGVKEYGFISLYDTEFEVIGNIHEQGVQ